MFDARLRPLIDPPLNRIGVSLARAGVSADAVTILGLGCGVMAAVAVAFVGPAWLALAALMMGRLADGLDGAIARASAKTDFGGYLDIAADFLFYGSIPLAFVLNDPISKTIDPLPRICRQSERSATETPPIRAAIQSAEIIAGTSITAATATR